MFEIAGGILLALLVLLLWEPILLICVAALHIAWGLLKILFVLAIGFTAIAAVAGMG